MIKHIVLIKLTAESKSAIPELAAMLRAMEGKIPPLKALEIGENIVVSERAYDVAIVAEFESVADIEAYQVHPVHKKVLEYLAAKKESVVAVDYEV